MAEAQWPFIIAGERLQEKFDEAVTCRFCQGNVELRENGRKCRQ